jgi:hypothetical protein
MFLRLTQMPICVYSSYIYVTEHLFLFSSILMAVIAVLIALIIYPVCFSGELQHGNRDLWEFGWAYGVAWGAAIFLFGGVVLLLLDKESEEIYYKERTVVHESQAGSDAASASNKG